METQKIVNLLNSSENEYSKFATKKWYVIESETKGDYSHKSLIKFLTFYAIKNFILFFAYKKCI